MTAEYYLVLLALGAALLALGTNVLYMIRYPHSEKFLLRLTTAIAVSYLAILYTFVAFGQTVNGHITIRLGVALALLLLAAEPLYDIIRRKP